MLDYYYQVVIRINCVVFCTVERVVNDKKVGCQAGLQIIVDSEEQKQGGYKGVIIMPSKHGKIQNIRTDHEKITSQL